MASAQGKKIRELYVAVDANLTGFERGMKAVGVGIDSAKREWRSKFSGFSEVSNQLANSLLGFSAIAAAGAVGLVRMAGQLEMTAASFEVLLGSAEKANRLLADLRDFSARTPFQFSQLANASQQLLAFGFSAEAIIPMMTAIGDAAMGNAEKIGRITLALGQMQAKGRVQAGEMLQLTEANINAYKYLAEAIGISQEELRRGMDTGKISLDARQAVKTILQGMETEFAGMMDRASQTLLGRWSTFIDTLEQVGQNRGGGLLETAGKVLDFASGLVQWLDKLNPKLLLWAGGLAAVGGVFLKLINFGIQLRYQLAGIAVAQMIQGGAAAAAAKQNVMLAGSFAAISLAAAVMAARVAAAMLTLVSMTVIVTSVMDLYEQFTTKKEDRKAFWDTRTGKLARFFGIGPQADMADDMAADAAKTAAEVVAAIERALGGQGPLVVAGQSDAGKINQLKYDMGQSVIRDRDRLAWATQGRLQMQQALIADYNAASDASERMRLRHQTDRARMAHEHEREQLALSMLQYREVYAATSEAAIKSINERYDLDRIRMTEQQRSALDMLDYRARKEEQQHRRQIEMDRQRYEQQKSYLLEIANSYLQYNRDYVRGIEAGIDRASRMQALPDDAGWRAARNQVVPLAPGMGRISNQVPQVALVHRVEVKTDSRMFTAEVRSEIDNTLRGEALLVPGVG